MCYLIESMRKVRTILFDFFFWFVCSYTIKITYRVNKKLYFIA